MGNRYQQTVDGSTTTYSLDLAAGLTQVLGDGSRNYTYGLGRIGGEQGGAWQYPLSDALGSVRQLTDASADVGMAQSFEPFGARMVTAGAESSDFGFTGEQDDIARPGFPARPLLRSEHRPLPYEGSFPGLPIFTLDAAPLYLRSE